MAMTEDTYRSSTRKSDLFLLALLLCAAFVLPLVIQRTQWVPQANRLMTVTLWSFLVGVVLAHTRFPDWLSWVIGIVLGLEYSVNFAGKLLPSFGSDRERSGASSGLDLALDRVSLPRRSTTIR